MKRFEWVVALCASYHIGSKLVIITRFVLKVKLKYIPIINILNGHESNTQRLNNYENDQKKKKKTKQKII